MTRFLSLFTALLAVVTLTAPTIVAAKEKMVAIEKWKGLTIFSEQKSTKKLDCGFEKTNKRDLLMVNQHFIVSGPINSIYPAYDKFDTLANHLANLTNKHCRHQTKKYQNTGVISYDLYGVISNSPGYPQNKRVVHVGRGTLQNPHFRQNSFRFQSVSRRNFELLGDFAAYKDTPKILLEGLRLSHSPAQIASARQTYLTNLRIEQEKARRITAERKRIADEQRRIAAQQRAAEEAARAERQASLANGSIYKNKDKSQVRRDILKVMDDVVTVDSRGWYFNKYARGTMRNLRTGFASDSFGGTGVYYKADYTYNKTKTGDVTFYMRGGKLECIKYWDSKCRDPYSASNPNYDKLLVTFVAAAALYGGHQNAQKRNRR